MYIMSNDGIGFIIQPLSVSHYNRAMPVRAFLLRCLLALALVAGGVPTFGMVNAVAIDEQASAITSCHDLEAAEFTITDLAATEAGTDTGCCDSADCVCDCLQHMPAAALTVTTLATPVFQTTALAPRSFERSGRNPSTTLRPPIG